MNVYFKHRLLPIVLFEKDHQAEKVAEVFLSEKLDLIEIPCRTPGALGAISKIHKAFPEITIGAGSLFTAEAIQKARDAGASFGVAPGLNPSTIEAAKSLEMPFIPGVMTPSDVEIALSLDCRLLKFFPCENAGGIDYLKALAEPFRETPVQFIPIGGVSLSNAASYLEIPKVAALGGTFMARSRLIQAQDWDGLRENIRKAMAVTALQTTNEHE